MSTVGTEPALPELVARLFASDAELMADPAPVWRRLHAEAPVLEHGAVVVLARHADVKRVVGDDGSSFSRGMLIYEGTRTREILARLTVEQRAAWDDVAALEGRFLSRVDGDQHARLRAVMHRTFTPRRIAGLAAEVERSTEQMLDELADAEVADLKRLSYELPLRVAHDLVGLPEADRALVHSWSDALAANMLNAEPDHVFGAAEAARSLRAYVQSLLEADDGTNELVSLLVAARAEGQLDEAELISNFVLLLFAAHQTTSKLISIGMLTLLRHRDQWQRLCERPELAPQATEELLRYVTPAQWLLHVARRDVEIGGVRIDAGRTVVSVLAAANRDPTVFADPDALDLTRANAAQHLSFSHGPHYCLGVSLARLEAETVFRKLAQRFPRLELAAADVGWKSQSMLRQLRSLPVRVAAPASAPAADAR